MLNQVEKFINPFSYQGTGIFDWIEAHKSGGYVTRMAVCIVLPEEFLGVLFSGDGFSIESGILKVSKDFKFDGASGPAVDGIGNMLAALVHDCLCIALAGKKVPGLTHAKADSLYRRICIAQNSGSFRAWYHYAGLRMFGWVWRIVK